MHTNVYVSNKEGKKDLESKPRSIFYLIPSSGDKDDNCWCSTWIPCNPFGAHHRCSCRFLARQERSTIHIWRLYRIAQKNIVLRARTWQEDVIGEGGTEQWLALLYNNSRNRSSMGDPNMRSGGSLTLCNSNHG